MRRGGVREGVWIGCFFPGHPLLRKHHAKECSSSLYLLGHSWVRDGNFTVEGLGTYLAYRKVGFELEFLGFLKWACTFCHTLLPTSSHGSCICRHSSRSMWRRQANQGGPGDLGHAGSSCLEGLCNENMTGPDYHRDETWEIQDSCQRWHMAQPLHLIL